MSLLLLWNGAPVAPTPTVVVVGGRPRRHPVRRKRQRVEADVHELAAALADQVTPAPWEADDRDVVDLLLADLL